MHAMIAQIPQKGKGAPAWVSRPQQGTSGTAPCQAVSALDSWHLPMVIRSSRSRLQPYRFSAPKPKPDDRSPVPPWSICPVRKFFIISFFSPSLVWGRPKNFISKMWPGGEACMGRIKHFTGYPILFPGVGPLRAVAGL